MKRLARIAGLSLSVLLLAQSPTPTPIPEPVFELHRTAEARHHHPLDEAPIFILVIGSDIREGDPATGRADSIHVVAVNPDSGAGTIVGIPRDSYVDIPGVGGNKINASLYYGGPELTVRTVSQISGLPIHYWALVDFSRFRQIVDRLEGLDMEMPYPINEPAFSGAVFDAGPFHHSGHSLLAFARVRYGLPGGDRERSLNQGRILQASLDKFRRETSDPIGMARYFEVFRDLVVSDVPTGELIDLALLARRMDPGALGNVVIPASGGSAGGQSVLFIDPGARGIFDAIRDDGIL